MDQSARRVVGGHRSCGRQRRGETQVWSLELTSPGNLTRTGWNRKSLKAGDKVELQVNPLRDGTHGGSFLQAKILDTGQVLAQPDFAAQERPGLQ